MQKTQIEFNKKPSCFFLLCAIKYTKRFMEIVSHSAIEFWPQNDVPLSAFSRYNGDSEKSCSQGPRAEEWQRLN